MAVVANNERILGSSDVGHVVQQSNSRADIQQFNYDSHQQDQTTTNNMTLDVLDQNHSQRGHINEVTNMNTNNVPINQEDRVNNGDLSIDQIESLASGQIYHHSPTNESTANHNLVRMDDSQISRGVESRLHNHSQSHQDQVQHRQLPTMNKNLPLKKIKVDFSRFVQPESAVIVSSQCDNIIGNVSCAPQVPSARVDSNLLQHLNPTQVLIVANNGSQQQQQQHQQQQQQQQQQPQQNIGYLTSEFNSQMQQQVNSLNSSLRSNLNGNSLDSDRIQSQVSNHYNGKDIALNFSHGLTQPTAAHQVHTPQIDQQHLLQQDTTRLLCENNQFNGNSAGSNWRSNLEPQSTMKQPNSDVVFQNGCNTSGQMPAPPWNQHDAAIHNNTASQLSSNLGTPANCYRQNRSVNIPNQFNGRSGLISSDQSNPFSYATVHHQQGVGHMGYRSNNHHQNHHHLHTNHNPHSSLSSNHHYESRSNSRSQTTTPSAVPTMNDPSSLMGPNSNPPSGFQLNLQLNLQSGPVSINQPSTSRSASVIQKPQSFKCSICGKVLQSKSLYQVHLKSHSQNQGNKAKFSCEMCGHSFSQKTSLNRHMKSHTGERPFSCEICAKAFSEKERLKIHMRTHTGEKPFSCHVCGKSFSQKSTVKRHQTVHTGEKKFRCDCGKGFANRGNLIAHIKTRGSNHSE